MDNNNDNREDNNRKDNNRDNNSNKKDKENNSNSNNVVKINIIATDGNYSYNKVINRGYNRDCNRHIIDKSETCLVESYNASLRGRLTMFNRRTKSYLKNFDSMFNVVFMWVHREYLMKNVRRYIRAA